ncbi:ecotropic viral integration site 5 ortholog-like isoform X2 [Euwallacea fornicatus]|uniref:ecotropic viral integration site 5 ortholog-like isoform X2 n=1 Tax=Euwallacea fornicatus TaxID=995702 RepID=UPI00338E1F0D
MFKLVENAYLSMQQRETERKIELQATKQLNENLKSKLKDLEDENEELRKKFTDNEIDVITRKNDMNHLLEMLQTERRAALEESQRLQICREQIDSINSYVEELKPIKEQLNFKQSVTECLHDLLVKTKLRIAESDDVLQELHDYHSQLEYDVEKTRNLQQHGLGHWQDEFLAARLREADVILEFDKLKREIATIKNELEEKILINEVYRTFHNAPANSKSQDSLPLAQHQQALLEEEISITRTVELQNEIDFLRHQLRKLEDQQKDCERKIKVNEEIKVHLNEVRRSIWLREFETNKKTETLKEKYGKLASRMSQELERVQKNIADKDLDIAKIEEDMKEIQKLNKSMKKDLKNQECDDEVVKLEKKRSELEKEIDRLKKT